jgi:hypothetical protein
MEKNVGGYDRLARFVVGPVLLLLGGAGLAGFVTLAAGTLGLALAGLALIVGAILAVTAVTQKCPLNSTLGLNTYRASPTDQSATGDADGSVE